MGAAYSQTGVLAKGRAEGSAGEIEELETPLCRGGWCRQRALSRVPRSAFLLVSPFAPTTYPLPWLRSAAHPRSQPQGACDIIPAQCR